LVFLLYLNFEIQISKYCYKVFISFKSNVRALIHTIIAMLFCILVWLLNEELYYNAGKNERTPGRCDECFTGLKSHGKDNLYSLAYIVVPVAIMLGLLVKGRGKLDGEREDTVFTSEQLNKDKLYRHEYDPFHLSRR
jgi:hypothetical protein